MQMVLVHIVHGLSARSEDLKTFWGSQPRTLTAAVTLWPTASFIQPQNGPNRKHYLIVVYEPLPSNTHTYPQTHIRLYIYRYNKKRR
jgi:hypothetical protein